MTVEKAIDVLEYSRGYEGMNFGAPRIALDMAIAALEEVQQYRAIDTVENLAKLKERHEKAMWLLDEERKQRRLLEEEVKKLKKQLVHKDELFDSDTQKTIEIVKIR